MDSTNLKAILQLHRTQAEFKAHRSNFREQSLLDSTHSYLSRQERNLQKDYLVSKLKVETRFMRRLSNQDRLLGGGVRTATLPLPISHQGSSMRRASEIPCSYSRHSWDPSWVDALTREKLQQRRQTYSGVFAHPSPQSRPCRGSVSGNPIPGSLPCHEMSGLIDSQGGGRPSNTGQLLNLLQPGTDLFDQTHDITKRRSASFSSRHTHVNNGSGIKDDKKRPLEIPAITIDSAEMTERDSGAGTATNCQPRIRAASADHFRRYSKLAAVFARMAGPPTSILSNNFLAVDEQSQDLCANHSDIDNVVVSRATTKRRSLPGEPFQSEAKASVLPLTLTTTVNNTRPVLPSNRQERADISNQFPVIQHMTLPYAKQNPAGQVNIFRKNSMRLAGSGDSAEMVLGLSKRRESCRAAGLQQRVVQFLEKQDEFNERFPRETQEGRSLQSVRPDLQSRKRRGQRDITVSQEKVKLVTEVLEALGLDDISYSVEN